MDDITLKTFAVCITFAVILGPFAARSSLRREPIYGGILAQIFHLAGTGAMMGVIPGVITALILGGGFGVAFPVAVFFLATSFGLLLIFALFEHPARSAHLAQAQDQGWTAEDARTSGL